MNQPNDSKPIKQVGWQKEGEMSRTCELSPEQPAWQGSRPFLWPGPQSERFGRNHDSTANRLTSSPPHWTLSPFPKPTQTSVQHYTPSADTANHPDLSPSSLRPQSQASSLVSKWSTRHSGMDLAGQLSKAHPWSRRHSMLNDLISTWDAFLGGGAGCRAWERALARLQNWAPKVWLSRSAAPHFQTCERDLDLNGTISNARWEFSSVCLVLRWEAECSWVTITLGYTKAVHQFAALCVLAMLGLAVS